MNTKATKNPTTNEVPQQQHKTPETVVTNFESALDAQTETLVTATIGCAITVHKALGLDFSNGRMNARSTSNSRRRESSSRPRCRFG